MAIKISGFNEAWKFQNPSKGAISFSPQIYDATYGLVLFSVENKNTASVSVVLYDKKPEIVEVNGLPEHNGAKPVGRISVGEISINPQSDILTPAHSAAIEFLLANSTATFEVVEL